MLTLATNQFGQDGKTLWGTPAPLSMGSVLRGKNLAVALVVLPAALIGSVVGAAIGGSWETLLGGVASLAGFLLWLGVGNALDLRRLPAPRGRHLREEDLQRQTGHIWVGGPHRRRAIAHPGAGSGADRHHQGRPAFGLVGAFVAALYGAMIWRLGSALAERSLRRRLPSWWLSSMRRGDLRPG